MNFSDVASRKAFVMDTMHHSLRASAEAKDDQQCVPAWPEAPQELHYLEQYYHGRIILCTSTVVVVSDCCRNCEAVKRTQPVRERLLRLKNRPHSEEFKAPATRPHSGGHWPVRTS